MGKVVAGATVSLDGYIAGPNESGMEHLFAWFDGGDMELPSVDPNFHARLSEPDYRYMRDFVEGIGVFVIGRRMFDLTDGFGGRHPFDKPIVVVTLSAPALGRRPSRRALHVRDRWAAGGHRAGATDRGRSERLRHARQDREPMPGAGPARRDLDRPRARAARLGRAVVRGAEGSADPPRWAGPARAGVSRHPSAVPGSSALRQA